LFPPRKTTTTTCGGRFYVTVFLARDVNCSIAQRETITISRQFVQRTTIFPSRLRKKLVKSAEGGEIDMRFPRVTATCDISVCMCVRERSCFRCSCGTLHNPKDCHTKATESMRSGSIFPALRN